MADLVRVHTFSDLLSAELMRGRLEADGILAEIKGEGAGPYRVGEVHLWVPEEDEEAARAVIEEVDSGSYELDDDERDDLPSSL